MAQIIGLFTAGAEKRLKRDWSNQDLAELYRVESALVQAGLHVETERGTSDEGDPWFVFCHSDGGDVIVHFARIDGVYLIASPVFAKPLRGMDLNKIVRRFVTDNPLSIPSPNTTLQGNVILHPAALLTIFVATVLVLSEPSEGMAAGLELNNFDGGTSGDEMDAPHIAGFSDLDLFAVSVDDGDHPRIGEKTMLLIAVAMAIEAVRFHDLDAGDPIDLVFGFDDDQFASLSQAHDQAADPEFAIDLFSSTDTMASDALPAMNDVPNDDQSPEGSGSFETAHLEQPIEDRPAYHDVPVVQQQSNDHSSTGGPLTGHDAAPQKPLLQLVSEHVNVEAPVPQHEQASGGEALNWFENRAAQQGWTIPVLDHDHSIVVQVAEMVGDRIGLQDAGEKDAPDSTDNGTSQQPVTATYQMFGPSAQQAIDYFQASDNDIAHIKQDGCIVIFDQSDFAAGQNLEGHIWVFDDHTTLMILGRASVVTEALGVSA